MLNRGLLTLRAVEPEDADAIWEMETMSDQWDHNGLMAPYSKANIRDYALTYDPDPLRSGQLRLMAEVQSDSGESSIVGIVDLYDISARNRTAFIGIYVKNSFRGYGYGHDMLSLIEDYALTVLNLRTLAAKISEDNKKSIGLFQSAGYRHAGRLTSWLESAGKTTDMNLFQKLLSNI